MTDINAELSAPADARQEQEAAKFLAVIPRVLQPAVARHLAQLLEVRLDVGRLPMAALTDGSQVRLSEKVMTREQIVRGAERIGRFDAENRAALDGCLHRFSRILNRNEQVIGLTLAFGRPLLGHQQRRVADFIGKSIQRHRATVGILGIAGSGKTTNLRQAAFTCGEFHGRAATVIDTSGEIAGNGDVPHWSIGEARRFLVPQPYRQKEVMIEVVQNHRPRVMIVDEIGTPLEAQMAKTVKERGCPLVFTVHAASLAGLIYNDELNLLTGGRRHVTVGDDRAAMKAGKKIEEERVTEPVADKVILIVDFHTAFVYHDVKKAVDLILRGEEDKVEVELITDSPWETVKFKDGQSYKMGALQAALTQRG